MVLGVFGENSKGTEFFVETDAERAIIHVRARGNLSLAESDRYGPGWSRTGYKASRVSSPRSASRVLADCPWDQNSQGPQDAIGQIQIELVPWRERGPGKEVLEEVRKRTADLPGIYVEVGEQRDGPQQGKPVQLEIRSANWDELHEAVLTAREKFDATPGLIDIDDTRPLPGIDWEITVDRARPPVASERTSQRSVPWCSW